MPGFQSHLFTLLAGFLGFAILFSDARPIRLGTTLVHLRLNSAEPRDDIHPTLHHKQHLDHAQSRFRWMSGREIIDNSKLQSSLRRRAAEELTGRRNDERKSNASGLVVRNAGITDAEIAAIANGGLTLSASSVVATNSLGLNIIANDVGYFVDVLIGTPPQTFRMLVDSGSADTWVGSDSCVSEIGGGCGDHIFLGPDFSSSLEVTTDSFDVTYTSGAISGVKVRDNFVVSDLSLNSHTFGLALNQTLDFASDGVLFDGIMGLARSAASSQNTPTPVEALAEQGLIQSAITSYKFGRLADGTNDGVITFGGLDESKFDPTTLVTVDNINTQGFWESNIDGVTINGVDTGLSGRTAILDTSSTVILCSEADAELIHQGIPDSRPDGHGNFVIPCTTDAVLALSLGGTAFEIDSRDLRLTPLNLNDPTGECISAISISDSENPNQWLVGTAFLKSVYFSHDATRNTISFARLV